MVNYFTIGIVFATSIGLIVSGFFRGWRRSQLRRSAERVRSEFESDPSPQELAGRVTKRIGDLAAANARLREAIIQSEDVLESLQIRDEQLRQAQQMQMVGQLAGSVAHDFTNLLTGIVGHAQFLVDDLPADHAAHQDAIAVKQAADRAVALSRQLLSCRHWQTVTPKTVDLAIVLMDAEKILRRLAGEQIEMGFEIEPDLPRVNAVPGQIEQVLMNLITNGREAMPCGGRLVIRVKCVVLDEAGKAISNSRMKGNYVVVTVADTGRGMDAATQAHIFEPFFTTKPRGQGIGLGLSTAAEIVSKMGGHISVSSTRGEGSTFDILLPAVIEAESPGDSNVRNADLRGSETVLVIEADSAIRLLIARTLERNGYVAIGVLDIGDALQRCRDYRSPIHAVIIDSQLLVSAEKDFVQALRELRPEIDRILLLTNGSASLSVFGDAPPRRVGVVERLFIAEELLPAVRFLMDSDHGNRPSPLAKSASIPLVAQPWGFASGANTPAQL